MLSKKIKLVFFILASLLVAGIILFYIFLRSPIYTGYVEFCNDSSCQVRDLPYQNPELSVEERVADLLSRMTLEEKIGQMALIENNSITNLDDIASFGLGAMLSGSGGNPDDNTPSGWLEMTTAFVSHSQKTRLGIPILYGVDAIHGHANIPGATVFPHAIGMAATKDEQLVKAVAQATAQELAATGVSWTFSPNLDVALDIRWGRTYETYGSNPDTIGRLAKAYIEGTQQINHNGIMVAAGAKHFVGQGAADWNTSVNKSYFIDQGNFTISENELRRTHIKPFEQAVAADVKSILIGLGRWNDEKVTSNKYLITDVLKNEMGFEGFTFSDWYGVYEKELNQYQAIVDSINAGLDMIMLPFEYRPFFAYMITAVNRGKIEMARIDDAVSRILKVKFEIGLMDNYQPTNAGLENIGSQVNRDLARVAVSKSLVLLKNNNALPISKNTPKVLVAGSAAHNLGRQFGGWTVEWQGIDGNWIPGTTILDGIRQVAPDVEIDFHEEGIFNNLNQPAEVGIVVVGEKPYAEGVGDVINATLTEDDLKTIYNLKKSVDKLIVVIISGRPLDIKEYADDWDAIVAAWLPGSEGQGVADVLFGDHPFTGNLPVPWEL